MNTAKIDIRKETTKLDNALAALKENISNSNLTSEDRLEIADDLGDCIEILEKLKTKIAEET